MQVVLIGKHVIQKVVLPQVAIGSYWISDKSKGMEKKLINIEGKDGSWQILSNNSIKIINNKYINLAARELNLGASKLQDAVIDKVILKEYAMYPICIGDSKEVYILYCTPVSENNLVKLTAKQINEILIGSSNENHIVYRNPLVLPQNARLIFNNGSWLIENLDRNFSIFVNDTPVFNNVAVLNNGDTIFIMGLKIIVMGRDFFINNPASSVTYTQELEGDNTIQAEIIDDDDDDDDDVELYSDKDYYSRAPRLTKIIEKEKVKIDSPPSVQSREEMPWYLTLGSTLSMGAIMMVSSFQSISGLINGTATLATTWPSLVIAFLMLIAMFLIPILTLKHNKKQKQKFEEKRQKRYLKYINSKIEVIDNIMNEQREILFKNYLSTEECANLIASRDPRLWERKIEDADFLVTRLGKGSRPLEIEIEYPEERFTMDDDNLVEMLNTIGDKSKTLQDAPITISFANSNISAIVSQNKDEIKKYIQELLIQLITFHSYEDLKFVFLLKKENEKDWDYLKMLPHIWDNSKSIRFFADDYKDMKEISRYLEKELQNRSQYEKPGIDYKSFSPYYLIITDNYKEIENLEIIKEVLEKKTNLGFGILCLADNLVQLPNECKTFVILENQSGMILESEISSNNKKAFSFDTNVTYNFNRIFKTISNIPIKYASQGNNVLPSSYTFLEMYDVGRIEQLNVIERWAKNDSTISLSAPIGVDINNMTISLDVHEKAHGPHGLIAGSTGSGKSEFIITYILSLAINYNPDDVSFVLIDYKGGGLAGAFKKQDFVLPHLAGTITNIDKVGLQRSLDSIQSELRKRQVMFNEARNITNESTIDIYKYQKLYHDGIIKKPIPHLLIICDEFAELKQQQPDFMDELISVARIGRSLGVHLILATQKPAGVVNDQIRSNSRFGVSLKVQDTSDSMDIIKKPDAAYLKRAGQFYLNVGNDEYFVLGQSGWTGAPYIPSDITKKEVDNSIDFISNIGTIIKKVDDIKPKVNQNRGDQLISIVRHLYEISQQENIKSKQLWLDNIPEKIYLDEIKQKYKIEEQVNLINPVIGEYDDPFNQKQDVVKLDLSNGGNTIIFGNAESGKETLISTMIYDIITSHSPDEVNLYVMDFGSEALKIFKDAPQVGDVLFLSDKEKISRIFDMLKNELLIRKEKLVEYNGDYKTYLKNAKEPMPLIVAIINNYEAFTENYLDEYEDVFQMITREGLKYGIIFVLTASTYNDIRYRLAQNFKQQFALQVNNEDEYYNIFDKIGKKRPSQLFGRGLIRIDEVVQEFQTARITNAEEWNNKIKDEIDGLRKSYITSARQVPTIPDSVEIEDVKGYLKDLSSVPIGLAKRTLSVYGWDFEKNFTTLVTAKNIDSILPFMINVIEEFKMLPNLDITVLDAERLIKKTKEELEADYKKFKETIESNNNNYNICVFLGVEKLINDLEGGENELFELIKKCEDKDNYRFVFVDNANRIKNHEYDSWFKNYVNKEDGIWIGNGIDDQYLINITGNRRDIVNNCGNSYGYVVKQGQQELIKLLGIKEDN